MHEDGALNECCVEERGGLSAELVDRGGFGANQLLVG